MNNAVGITSESMNPELRFTTRPTWETITSFIDGSLVVDLIDRQETRLNKASAVASQHSQPEALHILRKYPTSQVAKAQTTHVTHVPNPSGQHPQLRLPGSSTLNPEPQAPNQALSTPA